MDASRHVPEPAAGQNSNNIVGPTVRFKSTVQEIDPKNPMSESHTGKDDRVGEVSPEELKALSESLQGHTLQDQRMNHFNFEAYSLPPSRVSR